MEQLDENKNTKRRDYSNTGESSGIIQQAPLNNLAESPITEQISEKTVTPGSSVDKRAGLEMEPNNKKNTTGTQISEEKILPKENSSKSFSKENKPSTPSSTSPRDVTFPKSISLPESELRKRAVLFLFSALTHASQDDDPALDRLNEDAALAKSIEGHLNSEYLQPEQQKKKYTEQLKRLKFNLSDPTNRSFRDKVVQGEVDLKKLCQMGSDEMASDRKKRQREKIRQDSLAACRSDWRPESDKVKEGQFLCRKCNTKKTEYYQLQTRSADEPMTTFVSCHNCGNRWKF